MATIEGDGPRTVDEALVAMRAAAPGHGPGDPGTADPDLVRAALASLGDEEQRLLWLRHIDHADDAAIAAVLSLPVAAIGRRLRRAENALSTSIAAAHARATSPHAPQACSATRSRLDDYLRHRLPVRSRHVLEEHLFGCQGCMRALIDVRQSAWALRDAAPALLAGTAGLAAAGPVVVGAGPVVLGAAAAGASGGWGALLGAVGAVVGRARDRAGDALRELTGAGTRATAVVGSAAGVVVVGAVVAAALALSGQSADADAAAGASLDGGVGASRSADADPGADPAADPAADSGADGADGADLSADLGVTADESTARTWPAPTPTPRAGADPGSRSASALDSRGRADGADAAAASPAGDSPAAGSPAHEAPGEPDAPGGAAPTPIPTPTPSPTSTPSPTPTPTASPTPTPTASPRPTPPSDTPSTSTPTPTPPPDPVTASTLTVVVPSGDCAAPGRDRLTVYAVTAPGVGTGRGDALTTADATLDAGQRADLARHGVLVWTAPVGVWGVERGSWLVSSVACAEREVTFALTDPAPQGTTATLSPLLGGR
ncbi:zf-HC2 domain-containing protein [Xylanimonas ulmi]|uniref:Putative zinc finger protein n=1 Tax=Xylanimonas ulmi TaxID=228973 RepID=A0A4Q7M8Q6_9MICO|nr:zf-HC2 domain-containing protein [Xylanibacterium ulmi]RZS62549.1 putative zinc finger protein [Xylanibacterium ulmi]